MKQARSMAEGFAIKARHYVYPSPSLTVRIPLSLYASFAFPWLKLMDNIRRHRDETVLSDNTNVNSTSIIFFVQ